MGACAPCCVWALNDVRGSPRWLRWMSLIFSATSSERRIAEGEPTFAFVSTERRNALIIMR